MTELFQVAIIIKRKQSTTNANDDNGYNNGIKKAKLSYAFNKIYINDRTV